MSHDHDHDLGFTHDLPKMMGRRGVLRMMGAVGLASVAAPAVAMECVALPWETAGPYPGDGTNSRNGQVVNALTQAGVVREDLRPSFNGAEGLAGGVELTLDLVLTDAARCTALADHAIYLWHCDAQGRYSLYDLPEANYLRGVGVSDAEGRVRFKTIVPGCYAGRWPHMHFEIFETAAAAVSGEASVLTAQIALPEAVCREVYDADARYTNSVPHLSGVTLERDNVFGDNSDAQIEQQTPIMQGSVVDGYIGALSIPVDFDADRTISMPRPRGPRPQF